MQLATEKKKLRCSLHQLPNDGEKQPHLGKPLGSLLRQEQSCNLPWHRSSLDSGACSYFARER